MSTKEITSKTYKGQLSASAAIFFFALFALFLSSPEPHESRALLLVVVVSFVWHAVVRVVKWWRTE